MTKRLTKLSLFLLITSLALPTVQAEETTQAEESAQATEPSQAESTTAVEATTTANESSDQTMTNQEALSTATSIVKKTGESQYQFKEPKELIKALQDSPENMSSIFNLMVSENGVDFTIDSLAAIKDRQLYYVLNQNGNVGGTNVLIQTDEKNNFKTSYYLAEDLANDAAEMLNNDYEQYKGTKIEDYYVYAQEHIDEIIGTYIEHPEANESNKSLLNRFNLNDRWMVELINQYVEKNKDRAEVHQTDQEGTVYVFNIDQKESKQLAEFAESIVEGTDETRHFSEELKKGYIGTMSFSMKLGEIALSLATEDTHNIIEYRIGLEKTTIKQPDSKKIISSQDFVKKTGIDIFSGGLVSLATQAESTSLNEESTSSGDETTSSNEETTQADTTTQALSSQAETTTQKE